MRGKEFIFMLLPCIVLAGVGFLLARREVANEIEEGKREKIRALYAQPSNNAGPLRVKDVVVGKGTQAVNGRSISVHYSGMFINGQKFDSSWQRGQPFSFVLGGGQVIAGWEKGLAGMRVGGKRRLIIPPAMAYGATGSPPTVPPNATLIFDVQLLSVQ